MTEPLPSNGSTAWYNWAAQTDSLAKAALPATSAYTDEQAQDAAASLFTTGTHSGISFTYDDAGNKINATVSGGGGGGGGTATFAYRGTVTGSTTYNVNDVAVYAGRYILFKAAVTTSSGFSPFVGGANYIPLGKLNTFSAYDFGYRADGQTSSAAANTAALKLAIATCADWDGGVVEVPAGFSYVNKDGSNAWAIELPSNVILQGQGMRTTEIVLNASQNCTLVKAHTSTGSGDGNAICVGVRDLRLNGAKANQSAGSYHGIDLTTNPQYVAQTGDTAFDMHHVVRDVQIYHCAGNGVNMFGRSATLIDNVHSWNNDGHGFYGTFDTKLTNCQAESNGLSGFYNVTELTNCKAYLNGTVDPTQGHGFWFSGGVGAAVGCFSQNNAGNGVLFDGCRGSMFIGGVIDTNNNNTIGGTNGGGNYVGAKFINGAKKNVVTASSIQQDQSGAGFIGAQLSAVAIASGCTSNYVNMSHDVIGTYAGSAGPVVQAGSVTTGNTVIGNAATLTSLTPVQITAAAYAALGTPDPNTLYVVVG